MSNNGADWKEKLCFLTPSFEESMVAGKTQRFYPVSVYLLFKLRRVGKALARSVAVLFSNTATDIKTVERTVKAADGNGFDREVVIEPLSLEMAKYRDEQRAKALEEAIDALTSEENSEIVGEIMMDSLREVFDRDITKRDVTTKQFIQSLPAPMFTQLLVGLAKANKDVLGPLALKAGPIADLLQKAVERKVSDLTPPDAPTNNPPENKETAGLNSKTK